MALLEQQIDALSYASAKQLRELLARTPPEQPLTLPEIDPTTITETPQELSRQVETALFQILEKHREMLHSGSGENRNLTQHLIWQRDTLKAEFLPLAAKLRAIDPDSYSKICGGFEYVFLAPPVSLEKPTVCHPLDAQLVNRFCADRSSSGYRERSPRHSDTTTGSSLTDLVGY